MSYGKVGRTRGGVLFVSFGEYMCWKHYKKYIKARDLLEDDKSRQIFNLAMHAQMTDYFDCDFTGYGEGNQYFAIPEFNLLMGEKFVDVGAYVGDTMEELIRHSAADLIFDKYIGFEPDRRNIQAFEARKKRICAEWRMKDEAIEIVNAAVGNKNTMGSLHPDYSGSNNRVINNVGEDGFEIVKLDDFLKDQEVTFIKADVEGMEMDVIEGAAEIIKQKKPKMAICVYHLPWHLYEIMEKINEINSGYRFKMRLHSNSYNEIVLYCY